MTAKTSGITQRQSWADRATCPKRIIRVAVRVVRGNKTICGGMRNETRVAQKRGCGSWKINSMNWKRTIKTEGRT
jgi:hypothetical protein